LGVGFLPEVQVDVGESVAEGPGVAGQALGDALRDRGSAREGGGEQGGLVGVEVPDQRGVDAGVGGDRAHGGSVVAVFGEEGEGCVEDRVSGS
jgi:hypothetical protein